MDTNQFLYLRLVDGLRLAASPSDPGKPGRCTQCGAQVEQEAKFCDRCGSAFDITKKGPTGFGGWLILLVLGMMVFGPLIGTFGIHSQFTSAERQYPEILNLETWRLFKSVIWWTFIVFTVVRLYGGWGLLRSRKWSAVNRAKAILWIAGPIEVIVLSLIIPFVIFGKADPGRLEFILGLVSSGIGAGIWTAYLSMSVRVRNTYGDFQQ